MTEPEFVGSLGAGSVPTSTCVKIPHRKASKKIFGISYTEVGYHTGLIVRSDNQMLLSADLSIKTHDSVKAIADKTFYDASCLETRLLPSYSGDLANSSSLWPILVDRSVDVVYQPQWPFVRTSTGTRMCPFKDHQGDQCRQLQAVIGSCWLAQVDYPIIFMRTGRSPCLANRI